ncbi:glycosyltransferase involved in cell wall biosynthesis [Kibdelosporangium banguiense]|uniref:Glycosyltransferase involved in cell wall biosynthesis n=1 Tax=Kibdelosporangium banguiense TaxID=1365924 RepID=A0ABS4TB64_9PSEU|nr:glycosyltransferase [Kibdelosporangium banguiense]MBP2321660.1 glycosyltransferase involved in cell wall biosynthesis [Kibdelosporangium banguiense]
MGTDDVQLTYIVPAHNSGQMIEGTLKELRDHLAGKKAEIVVVENGSSDNTLELLRQVETNWDHGDVRLRVLQSAKGLGNALKHGISMSRGARIFIGADDLPFGFGDLDKAEKIDHAEHPVVIGSKGHPESQAGRGLVRAILTFGFLSVRWVILGMRTRDPQGTFALDGKWARGVAPRLNEPGFLMTTELVYLAEKSGIRTVEVPVVLSEAHMAHSSRIRLNDIFTMFIGLFKVRKHHRRSRAA